MKAKYLRARLFVILIAFAMFVCCLPTCLSAGGFSFGNVAYAAEDKVNFTVNVDPKGPFDANQYIRITVDFSANPADGSPANYVKGGDSFEVKWESTDEKVRFDAFSKTQFDLFDANDVALANAVITKEGAVVTFYDTVNNMHDISGELFINGMVINNHDAGSDDKTVTVTINGNAETNLVIHPGGADTGTPRIFKKSGYTQTLSDGTPIFTWTLMVNGEFKDDFTGNLTITDSLEGKGHIFVGDTDKKGNYYIRVTDGNDQTVDEHFEMDGKDVYGYRKTTGYFFGEIQQYGWANHNNKFVVSPSPTTTMEGYLEDISFSEDSKKMTISIPSEKVNEKFIEIIYITVPIEDHNDDGGKYENLAELKYSDSTVTDETDDWSDDIYYEDSGGKITGVPNESFKIIKNEDGTTTPIEGVTFKIKRADEKPFRDGTIEKTVTTDEKGEALITNLAPGKYIVTELSAPNIYIVSDEKYEFEMEHAGISHTFYNKKKDTPPTKNISVEKTWENCDPATADDVVAVLSGTNWDGKDADGETVTTEVTLNNDNEWKHTWENLPEKDSSENTITYSVDEKTVPSGFDKTVSDDGNGNFTITNKKQIPETTTISGTKKWVDGGLTHDNSADVTLTLKRTSENPSGSEETVDATPEWNEDKYSFTDLDKNDAEGYEYTYWVVEGQVSGYKEPAYSNKSGDVTDKALDGATITNTKEEIETIEITGTKTWDDENDKDGIRPASIIINLMNGDEKVDSKTVTEDDDWSWTFTDLPKYDNDENEIKYSITENPVEGYATEVNDYDVTNKHTPEEEPPEEDEPEEPEEPDKPKTPLLSVKKVSKVDKALPGDVIPYVITIKNKGDGDAHDVYVIDTMGEYLTYVSDDSGGVQDGSEITWTLDLAAGETKTIVIRCVIDEDAQGNIFNNVELSGVESEYLEPYENEDTAVLGVYEDETHEKTDGKTNGKKSGKTNVKSAKTGDESNALIWITMMLISLGAVAAIAVHRREN